MSPQIYDIFINFKFLSYWESNGISSEHLLLPDDIQSTYDVILLPDFSRHKYRLEFAHERNNQQRLWAYP